MKVLVTVAGLMLATGGGWLQLHPYDWYGAGVASAVAVGSYLVGLYQISPGGRKHGH